jgi:NADH-quinone oxidoreductase subunit J
MDAILFYCLAGLALASAVLVVAQRHAIGSALALIVTLSALSGIFGLLGSPFIAVLQLVVYAGAIMVLFVFVLMLLNVQREEQQARGGRRLRLVAVGIAAFFLLQLGSAVVRLNMMPSAAPFAASARDVARLLFSAQYLYAFEATSVLILAALVGAIALARKETQ